MSRFILALHFAGGLSLAGGAVTLTIEASGAQTNQALLKWNATPGCDYTVLTTTNLLQPWTASVADSGPWIAKVTTLTQAVLVAESAQFFRIQESPSPYDPAWAGVGATVTNHFLYDAGQTTVQNGAALKVVLQSLQAGERIEIAAGTYSINSYTTLDLQGTPEAPIWVTAAPGAAVIITRPDAGQNVLNVGAAQPARYLCLRNLEFTGGSHGLRLFNCQNVWVDGCRMHDTGDVGLSANARDTSQLYLTRNEIWNTGGTGEGMYLGGNNASVIMSRSVIALNHVHDTDQGVSQGDGIEVKQGSWGNLIAENRVHDCQYPCILVYGTGGQPPNIVERNVCFRSGDNTLQIQGECIVRNNLVIAGAGSAFASQPHQGSPTRMTVVHNTFVNAGHAVNLGTWGAGTNMVFANNACYSRDANAIRAVNGFGGVVFAGNVCLGAVAAGISGHQPGSDLADFVSVNWDGTEHDARPAAISPLWGAADPVHSLPRDIEFEARAIPPTAGCYGP